MGERAKEMAEERGVEIRSYRVIYDVIEQLKSALAGLLEPEKREERVGLAEVRQLFKISRIGTIAGCYVAEGALRRDCNVRVMRDGEVVHEGPIA
jgi:translation initiation factor IF-2